MTNEEFWKKYKLLFRTTLESGIRYRVPSQLPGPEVGLSAAEIKRFRADCHRGYDKGQRGALRVLNEIEAAGGDPDLIQWRSLHVRKIMDAVAYTLFGMSTYPLRRLGYLDNPPGVNFEVAEEAVGEATKRNARSRQRFTLVTDLTTSVHVADLVTIDFQTGQPVLRLEE